MKQVSSILATLARPPMLLKDLLRGGGRMLFHRGRFFHRTRLHLFLFTEAQHKSNENMKPRMPISALNNRLLF
jgi:hypothetical protein